MSAIQSVLRYHIPAGGEEIEVKSKSPLCVRHKNGEGVTMPRMTPQIVTALALLCMQAVLPSGNASAQEIDFGQINKFESLGTGTLRVGAPPKTIVDDGERHVVILTIWDADAETKVYWKPPDADTPRTTIIPGKGIQTFQTAGELKLEAIGEPERRVEYGYVLLGLRK